MPKTASKTHSAVDSAVGYYHQGLYALVVLLDAADGDAVSVESEDDVVLHGSDVTLHQLKHSLGKPKPLTLKNKGLWNTIEFWADGPFDGSVSFFFVTCAPIKKKSVLEVCTQKKSDRAKLLTEMEAETNRVKAAREEAADKGKKIPHADRWPGCERFQKLSSTNKEKLLRLITITASSFTAAMVPVEVEKRLSAVVTPSIRKRFVERLIEWWDRQVALSLLRQRSRTLTKLELQNRIHELLVEHSPNGLPDDFSLKVPPSVSAEVGRVMEKQIAWVKGGESRVNRAAVARWRARNQRNKWLEDDLAVAGELTTFDKRLAEAWNGRWGPMKDDCKGKTEDECCESGRGILDWTHNNAHQELPPIRSLWPHAFLVQGSFQQLAEDGDVGWHPGYKELLDADKAGGSGGAS